MRLRRPGGPSERERSDQTAFQVTAAQAFARRGRRVDVARGVRRRREGVRGDPRRRGGVGRLAAEQVGVPRTRRPEGRPAGVQQRRARPRGRAGAVRRVPRCRRAHGGRRDRVQHRAGGPLLGDDQRPGPRRALRGAVAGPRRGVRVDHAVDAASRRDRSAVARSRPEAHGRGHRVTALLPVHPAADPGRRRGRAPVADRVRRRARVRAVPARPRRRRDPLERGRRRGRDADRHRRHRGRPGRGRADRDRLRLRAARAHAVRLQSRPDGASRPGARFRRRGRAARRRRGPAPPLRHAALRGRRAPRVRSGGHEGRRGGGSRSRARRTARGSARSGSP